MKILVANDDGIHAEGLKILVRALCPEHEVFVSAPNSQRSGAAHSLTLQEPLNVVPTQMEGLPNVKAYAVSGTPADCVRLAISNLIERPDLVISGINMGANLGTDVYYSGTVAAAMEGTIFGLPSMAVSICSHHPKHLETAAHWAMKALSLMFTGGDPKKPICDLLSINVPDIPLDEVCGAKFASLCVREYPERYDICGDNAYIIPKWGMLSRDPNENHDHNAVTSGFVAFTPLMTQRCDYERLEALKNEIEL